MQSELHASIASLSSSPYISGRGFYLYQKLKEIDCVSGSSCCSKVLVGSTGQARVDQALYMGIYARSLFSLKNMATFPGNSLTPGFPAIQLFADTQQTTMGRQCTGGREGRRSTSISSPGTVSLFPNPPQKNWMGKN